MDCSTSGFPVHHQLPDFAPTHVHGVGDAIRPSHLQLSPSPAFSLSQHQSLPMSRCFASGGQSIGVSASASVLPMNIQDWFPLGWTGWVSYTVTKIKPGADCGSDLELLIAKFRLKLSNVGKTTRPFRCDLHQTPYDYKVEVMNKFNGLDFFLSRGTNLREQTPDLFSTGTPGRVDF